MAKFRRSPKKKSKPVNQRRKILWRFAFGFMALALVIFFVWTVCLDIEVRQKFAGRKWELPARVYAQPLELYTGKPLRLDDLRVELGALDYRPVEQVTRPGLWSLQGDRVEIFLRDRQIGSVTRSQQRVTFRLRDDRVADFRVVDQPAEAIVTLEPAVIGGIYPRRQEDRELVKLEQIPPLLGEALIAVEDRNFASHHGVSPKAILRAAVSNVRSGRVVQGGSTITQQLVKNFFLDPSRSLTRKATEAMMSLLLELHFSKGEILETYINEVYLGQSGPRQIHGFGLASRHYFQKPLVSLSTAEIALLVGLVKGASFYNPWRHPERAKERRDLVLDVLAREKLISPADAEKAKAEPLSVVDPSRRTLGSYPAFIDLVKRQLRKDYSDDVLAVEGLQVYTTLSLSAQRKAEEAVAEKLQQLEADYKVAQDSLQSALVLTSVGSGEIEAVVGDRDAKFAGFNRALDARRPIGSLVKPAVYLSAVTAEGGHHLASIVSDEPIAVEEPNGQVWRPNNFRRSSHGEVTLLEALSHSYNQATARLGMEVGIPAVTQTLQQLGVNTAIPQVPALFLGALNLSPLDVTEMYHTMANDGIYMPLRAVRSVLDAEGNPQRRYPLKLQQTLEPSAVHLIQYALQAVMQEGTGRAAYQRLPRSLMLAGKTGTTNGQRDSWFAGYDGRHLGVVWVGRDDNGKTPLTGSSGALRVWTDLYARMATESIQLQAAENLKYLWIDPKTGLLSGENCEGAQLVPFTETRRPRSKGSCVHLQNPVIHWFKKIL